MSISSRNTLAGQFAQALRNILAILAVDGAGPEHIVRLTCYVTSIERISRQPRAKSAPAWKEIMGRALSGDGAGRSRPAGRTAAKVEIEATAVVPNESVIARS